MFLKISGKPKTEWFPYLASTVAKNGQPAIFNGSGFLEPITAASSIDIFGILMKDVASTDSDYATAKKLPVQPVGEDDIFEADVLTGTLTTAMVGNRYDFDATLMGVDVTAQSHKQVLIVGFKSATVALVKFTSYVVHQVAS